MLCSSRIHCLPIAAALLVGATWLTVDAAAPGDAAGAPAPADERLDSQFAEVFVVLEAGKEFMSAGYLTRPENARPGGIATVKCMHLKGIVMDESSARLAQATGNRFEYSAKLRAPDKPGLYTLEVWFERRPVCLTRILVEEAK